MSSGVRALVGCALDTLGFAAAMVCGTLSVLFIRGAGETALGWALAATATIAGSVSLGLAQSASRSTVRARRPQWIAATVLGWSVVPTAAALVDVDAKFAWAATAAPFAGGAFQMLAVRLGIRRSVSWLAAHGLASLLSLAPVFIAASSSTLLGRSCVLLVPITFGVATGLAGARLAPGDDPGPH